MCSGGSRLLPQSGSPLRWSESLPALPCQEPESGRIYSGFSCDLTEGILGGHSSVVTVLDPQLDPQLLRVPRPSQSPSALPSTQGRSGSGYLMNRMPTWRRRSSRRPPGAESA